MTMPTVEKTWQFNTASGASSVNQVKPILSGGNAYDCAALLLMIKKTLCGFTNSPWIVTGSSNGTAAGMDAVDRWPTSLVGTNTSASVDTSTNNTLRIRTLESYFRVFTVTAGASTAKTLIASDLNTAFAAAGLTLSAGITGTNQLTISDTSSNANIEIDTIANGSTLGTPCGFTSGGMRTTGSSAFIWNSAGSAHSWIVLKQTGVHSTYEICLDCNSSSQYQMSVVMGTSGFTGGTTTARPTATSQIILLNTNSWQAGQSGAFGAVLHIMQSTDGECTRIIMMYNGFPCSFWMFDKPKNPVAGWLLPALGLVTGGTAGSYTQLPWFNDTARVSSMIGATAAAFFLTCEGLVTQTIPEFLSSTNMYPFQQRNQITLEQFVYPIGLVTETTGVRGRHGQLFDLWWGNMNNNNMGGLAETTYPDDSTRVYWQSDHMIFPWPGINTPPGPMPLVRY